MRDLHGGWRQGVRWEASYILSDEEESMEERSGNSVGGISVRWLYSINPSIPTPLSQQETQVATNFSQHRHQLK